MEDPHPEGDLAPHRWPEGSGDPRMALGGVLCASPLLLACLNPSFIFTSGAAFLPLSAQNTYNLNPSLAGK